MFWFQHPNVLIKDFELWPKEDMDFNRKLNAISRLVMLLTVLGFGYTQNLRFLTVGVATLIAIVFLHRQKKELDTKEGFSLQDIVPPNNMTFYKPNAKNPLSNVLLTEILDDPDRDAAPPAFNPPTTKEINQDTRKWFNNNIQISQG